MALSLDDKLLGEKTHYYCSSSEDEEEEDCDKECSGDESLGARAASSEQTSLPQPEISEYKGHCTNTGPKGVLTDWRRFKQLEIEKREESERERSQLAKKLTLTCRSHLDDEKEKAKDELFVNDLEAALEDFEDEFIKEYRQKRIDEMRNVLANVPKFGKLYTLSKAEFIDAIDKEKPTVTVMVHIYEDDVKACRSMNGCFKCLAREYLTVKFCNIRASDVKLSMAFSVSGVPALLVYKRGELIGNFVRMSDDLGEDFFATDVESFLVEHGMLPDKRIHPAGIRDQCGAEDDSGSDFDVD